MIQPKNIGCRWYSSVFFLRQPTGHWFSCQMGVCHWSPSVAKTDEDQRQPMFFGCIIWAYIDCSLFQSLLVSSPMPLKYYCGNPLRNAVLANICWISGLKPKRICEQIHNIVFRPAHFSLFGLWENNKCHVHVPGLPFVLISSCRTKIGWSTWVDVFVPTLHFRKL